MTGLSLSSEGYITGVNITNLGSVTSQIRAFYVNSQLVCDPSNSMLNTNNAYIKAQDFEMINIEPILFDPDSYIAMATSYGMKAIELESNLVTGTVPSSVPMITYYGPLRLNFSLFYYQETDANGNPIGTWKPGAHMPSTVVSCRWNITVTNIETRDITLNQYSSLTLVTNIGGSQFPWYIKSPGLLIASNETISIVYVWQNQFPCTVAQGFQGFSSVTSKVFITFYGKFSDGATYGQTIPFEGVKRS